MDSWRDSRVGRQLGWHSLLGAPQAGNENARGPEVQSAVPALSAGSPSTCSNACTLALVRMRELRGPVSHRSATLPAPTAAVAWSHPRPSAASRSPLFHPAKLVEPCGCARVWKTLLFLLSDWPIIDRVTKMRPWSYSALAGSSDVPSRCTTALVANLLDLTRAQLECLPCLTSGYTSANARVSLSNERFAAETEFRHGSRRPISGFSSNRMSASI